jgi:nitric oxide reductase subunit B
MKNRINYSVCFMALGILALLATIVFGILGSLVYLYPDFLKDTLPFNQLRPLHVSNAVAWVVLAATGGLYYHLQNEASWEWRYPRLIAAHFWIFFLTGLGIWFSYLAGQMGGREYLAFAPVLILPVLAGWILFGFNYYKSIFGKIKNWPVYYWMWLIGLGFMVYHLCEANFWMLNHFRSNFILDKTVQWKSYGSFVGSWNMLVYGTAIFVMTKIKGDSNSARGRKVFFFFFLGLANLMFGWAHHTYTLPTLPWVRYGAYMISMTEWILFASIIYSWSKSLKPEQKKSKPWAYRFLIAADVWVFLNLFLALLMSIPAINFFTHGTHVTVAHSMGTTIGINTSILLASICFVVENHRLSKAFSKLFSYGYYLFNCSLFALWMALILAGWYKSSWQHGQNDMSFGEMQNESNPFFILFVFNGFLMGLGLVMVLIPLLRKLLPLIKESTPAPTAEI